MDVMAFFAAFSARANSRTGNASAASGMTGGVALADGVWATRGRPDSRPSEPMPRPFVLGLLAGLDGIGLTVAGCLTITLHADPAYLAQQWPRYAAMSASGALCSLLLGHRAGLYSPGILNTPFLKPFQAIACWGAALVCVLATLFLLNIDDPVWRGWVLLYSVSGAASLGAVRLGLRARIAHWRATFRLRQSVVVVGNLAQTAATIARLEQASLREYYAVAGIFPIDKAAQDQTQGLASFVRDRGAETVMICMGQSENCPLGALELALAELPVDVLLCLDEAAFPLPVLTTHRHGSLSLLQVGRRPMGEWGKIVKAVQDRILGFLLLLLLAPVMLVAAVAIKLDSRGPILFRQQRYGFNNQPISVLKFRTMHANRGDPTGAARTMRHDPRVTGVGRLLRKSSLDELPQLINVLRGEMSLVGPRAHPVIMKVNNRLYEDVVPGYKARHRVKPGITGLAQINGCRGEVDSVEKAEARLRHDLDYVSRVSLWLDLKIILLTPIKAMRKAY